MSEITGYSDEELNERALRLRCKDYREQIKKLIEEKKYWEEKFSSLEINRASCCMDNEERVKVLENALKSVDFWLDEFGSGYCAVPQTTSNPSDVVEAVCNALQYFRTKKTL